MSKVKIIKHKQNHDSTDTHLQVKSYANSEIYDWDSDKIISALREECTLSKKDAIKIADLVLNDVLKRDKKEIDISTLKNIINYHLFAEGFNGVKLAGQVNLGMSLYDLKDLISEKSAENSNISNNNPEAISLTVSEDTFKKYALKEVFSKDVSTAHLEGLIHLHDLGQINKVYCSAHSLRSIAMNGLGKYFNFDIKSKPAKHAQTLVGHLNTFLCSMSHFYAGALGVDFVNVYFAPYVDQMNKKEMRQLAQYLIFSLSQSAFSRGGQVLFTDFNVHISIPDWMKKVQAVGPGGTLLIKYMYQEKELTKDNFNKHFDSFTSSWSDIENATPKELKALGITIVPKTYADYEETSRKFLYAMMDVWEEGDSSGEPFPFPKFDLHVCEEDFTVPENIKLLERACGVASKNGSPYFIMDRDNITLAACCRLRTKLENKTLFKNPERIRFCGFQNVTINIPQCAYRANGDLTKTLSEIRKAMDLAIKAHLQKKEHVKKIGTYKNSPLYPIVTEKYFDGKPYVDVDASTYIVGLIGVNEAVKKITGNNLHESDEAFEMGLDIITYMYSRLGYYKEKYGLKFTLEESPAESAARRLAKVDVEKYEEAKEYVNGSLEENNIYYTNSIHFKPNADIDIITRITKQSEFHEMIESGAIIHVFCGENLPSTKSVYNLINKVFHQTQCAQICISPDFTICHSCEKTFPGLQTECPICKTKDVKHMSRVVGYFSLIENWNVSKQKEHMDRRDGQYGIGE